LAGGGFAPNFAGFWLATSVGALRLRSRLGRGCLFSLTTFGPSRANSPGFGLFLSDFQSDWAFPGAFSILAELFLDDVARLRAVWHAGNFPRSVSGLPVKR